jgi:O-antigen/teichoic acid export membrane protein
MVAKIASEGGGREVLHEIRRRSGNLMHILFPLSILLVLISPVLYRTFFNESFSGSALIFNTYLLLLASRLVFPQAILLGNRRNRLVMYVSIIEIITNILLSLFLARIFGIVGVAIGTVLAYYIDKVIQASLVYREYGISPNEYIPVKPLLAYSVVLLTIYLLGLRFI